MSNLHDYLVSLKSDVDAGEGEARTRELAREALNAINTDGNHGAMFKAAIQSLGYVLDVAVNQGTADDMWELRELLDDSGSSFDAQPDADQSRELIGLLYRYNFKPEDEISYSATPLDDILDAFTREIGSTAMYAVLAYVEANYEESDEDEDEDEDEDNES